MPGRVLNFSEFFGKYSSEGGDSNQNLDTFTQSSSNFEEGFDDSTYNQNQLGPNRPVSRGDEMTPAQPGEKGIAAFNAAIDSSMDAPEIEMPDETEGELDMSAPEEQESIESKPDDTEEETKENKVDSEEEEEEDDAEETDVPEPEAGANPKNLKESNLLIGFTQFINESNFDPYADEYDEYPEDYEEDDEYFGEYGMNPETNDDIEGYFPDDLCPNCGDEIGYSPEGITCGCNM